MQGSKRQQYQDAKALSSLEGHPGLLALQGQQYDDLAHLIVSWVKGPQNDLAFHVNVQGQAKALLGEIGRLHQAKQLLRQIDPEDPQFDEADRGTRNYPWLHAFLDRLKGGLTRG